MSLFETRRRMMKCDGQCLLLQYDCARTRTPSVAPTRAGLLAGAVPSSIPTCWPRVSPCASDVRPTPAPSEAGARRSTGLPPTSTTPRPPPPPPPHTDQLDLSSALYRLSSHASLPPLCSSSSPPAAAAAHSCCRLMLLATPPAPLTKYPTTVSRLSYYNAKVRMAR